MLHQIGGMRLDNALILAYTRRSKSPWLFSQLVFAEGSAIERYHEEYQWPIGRLRSSKGGAVKRMRQEHCLMQALGDLPMAVVRNQWRAAKLLAALGFHGVRHLA